MFKKLLVASVTFGTLAAMSTPSLALKGIEALDQCVKTPGCGIIGSKGGSIMLLPATGGAVTCESLEAECVAHKTVPAQAPSTASQDDNDDDDDGHTIGTSEPRGPKKDPKSVVGSGGGRGPTTEGQIQ